MHFFKRAGYLVYYLRELDLKKFRLFLDYAGSVSGRSLMSILTDCICSVFRYNISLQDYFYFRFFEKKKAERKQWAGTGFMYEYQLKMNPKKARAILENKLAFNKRYGDYIRREYHELHDLESHPDVTGEFLNNTCGKVVLKNSMGQAGQEVCVIDTRDLSPEKLITLMKTRGYDLAEEYVIQHDDMMHLSPSGLNTVRIITQETNGNIDILVARLRISINSFVDNLAAGNAAAPVDIKSGIVNGPAVFSDITKTDITVHPVTDVEIPGFQVPFWNEVITMATKAARMSPENRSVGWDIAVCSSGPVLVEGNHNWCKLLWQLPVKQGLKKELERYL